MLDCIIIHSAITVKKFCLERNLGGSFLYDRMIKNNSRNFPTTTPRETKYMVYLRVLQNIYHGNYVTSILYLFSLKRFIVRLPLI